jgi:hypothetical protein
LDEFFEASEAVVPEEIAEVDRRHVDEDVLHVQQQREVERRLDVLLLEHLATAQQENPKEDSIVLEVNVIDDDESNITQDQQSVISFPKQILLAGLEAS